MTSKSGKIEVTVMGEAAVVRFRRTECQTWSLHPWQDVEEDLYALVDRDHYSVIVIDFENKDLRWVSGAFYSMLVGLHRRSFKATGVLKLCNVPETIMERFREYRFVEVFNIYPNLEAALKSDT
jgi:anti-anti-sigma regulatory factor